MRPSKYFLLLLLVLFLVGLGACFLPSLSLPCLVGGGVLLTLALADGLLAWRKKNLHFDRDYPNRFALDSSTEVQCSVINRGNSSVYIRCYDGIPSHCQSNGFPFAQKIPAREFATFTSNLVFQRRGDHEISPAHLEILSPFRLWWKARRIGEAENIQVYPNYRPVLEYGLLATSDRLEQMGIVKKRNKGLSKEFHQLRDYHEGDPITHIDWNATSRFNRLISREFQEERDQNILLVADCSIRTRAIDQDLPILDHLLNAMILIAYMAIKQGDKISITNFGTTPEAERYLAAVKGPSAMPQVLDHLYNYQSTNSYGEYTDLAKRILSYPIKRSLVIILTNLRTEDQYGCVEALNLLSQKHMVLLASVQETSVSEILKTPIYTPEESYRYQGATAYEQDADQVVSELMQQGINVLRSPIESYGVELANRYIDIRSTISA